MRWGAISVAVLLGACTYSDARTACERLAGSEAGPTRQRAAVCLAEYQRTGAASAGLEAARAMLDGGRPDEAAALAQELFASALEAEALQVAAKAEDKRGDAVRALELRQRRLVRLLGDGKSTLASRAAHEIAGARWQLGEMTQAMASSRLAVEEADRAGDSAMRVFARLGLAEHYRSHDQLVDAERLLLDADDLASSDADRAWTAAKLGSHYMDAGLDSMARSSLESALRLAETDDNKLRLSLHLNLAWVYRRSGQYALAHARLAQAAAISAEDVDLWIGRGLLLADQGYRAAGVRQLEGAVQRADGDRDLWWAWYHLGRLQQQHGDVAAARQAYQRSMHSVAALASKAGEYVSELAASHRSPYLRAIGLAARHGHWREALALVLELDGLALLAAERVSEEARASGGAGISRIGARGSPVSIDEMLAAWRGRQLSIVLSEQETVWRLEVRDGQVSGREVGRAEVLARAADALEADPSVAGPARALGAALAPAEWNDAPVHVLTIGPLSRAPLPAVVRPRGAAAPLVRVLSVLPRPASKPSDSRTIVLGDPRGDLPWAGREASLVAERLGVTAVLGPAANAGAVASARGAALLHVAAHSRLGDSGPALLLAGSALDATAVASQPGAPRVVVLASCGSAAARDDGGWGSLAAAFLTAGSDAVIASAWSVDDAATLQFIDELYRHPVAADPVAALAAAQKATRARLPARSWAAFIVIAAPPALAR